MLRHEDKFDELYAQVDDLTVQLKFWKQAAEHAVTGWNQLEDKYDELTQKLRDLVQCPGPCLGDMPAEKSEEILVDRGDGKSLLLIELETPRKR